MCKCWKCGANQILGKPGVSTKTNPNVWRAQARAFAMRGENAAGLEVVPQPPRPAPGAYIETPVAQQTMESSVKVPLATATISGAFTGALALCGWVYLGWPQPVTATVASTLVATWWGWRGSLGFARSLLHRVEDFTGVDLDGDGNVGQATKTVYTPMPVNTGPKKAKLVKQSIPAPKSSRPGADSPVMIRRADSKRSARTVTLGDVWDFMVVSFKRDDWTKATWTGRGMSQPLWKDYQDFLKSFGWWKITDTALLNTALQRFCAPDNYLTDYLTNYPQETDADEA